jgi:DNA-binding helix-hairpin-helix protein with protein kinase domain
MTRLRCPTCRLRFTHAAAAHLVNCPSCQAPLQVATTAAQALGDRLADAVALPADAPIAIPVAIPVALPLAGTVARPEGDA